MRHSGAVTSMLKLKMEKKFKSVLRTAGHLILALEKRART
jgi:hypothetical protein